MSHLTCLTPYNNSHHSTGSWGPYQVKRMGPARPLSGESGISLGRILDTSASAASASSQKPDGKAIRRLYSPKAARASLLSATDERALPPQPSGMRSKQKSIQGYRCTAPHLPLLLLLLLLLKCSRRQWMVTLLPVRLVQDEKVLWEETGEGTITSWVQASCLTSKVIHCISDSGSNQFISYVAISRTLRGKPLL